MKTRSPIFRVILAVLVLIAPSLWAQDGLRGAESKSRNASGLPHTFFGPKLVAADFDNDHKPDGALLLDAGTIDGQRMFRIELHYSASQDYDLTFASSDRAIAISALDVNRDGLPDLIVEQTFTRKRLQVWLNEGHGRFRQARVEDFPPLTDAPCKWQAPISEQACVVLWLPSRVETHRAILLLQILRFNSSSSHWRMALEMSKARQLAAVLHSPRAPPTSLPL